MPEFEHDFIEYGIAARSEIRGDTVLTAQMYGMAIEDAKQWIKRWERYGGDKNAFVIISRPVGKWKMVLE